MIKIILDSSSLYQQTDSLVVDQIQEYPRIYALVSEALLAHQDLTVFLRHPIVNGWFKNMASRYPSAAFLFVTMDARGALELRWGMPIPQDVSNDEIRQAGLLNLDIKPQPGTSFEDVLLSHFYAPILTASTFPVTQLNDLFMAINPEKWKANRLVPLLTRMLNKRLDLWRSSARNQEFRQVIDSFSEDPNALWRVLMAFRVLRCYPALGEKVLEEWYPILQSLKLPLDDLSIDESMIPETVLQITFYLNRHHPEDTAELEALLEGMSGLLMIEFDTIAAHIQDHPEWVNLGLIDQVEHKFTSLDRRVSSQIAELRAMIRPVKPSKPDPDWDVARMLDWAINAYLPYQSWCDAHDQLDADVFTIGDQFSEWLMQHWTDIHINSRRMVFNILPNLAAELKRTGAVNIVLVVDNLGWSFSSILSEMFQARKFTLMQSEPYFAMLPTETEISKKCLLAGAVGYREIDDLSYKKMIERGWTPYFGDQGFQYISDIGGLKKITSIDTTTYVVNYLAVDKALHKSSDEIGMPHRDHIKHLLERIVDNVVAFIEKHGIRERVRIFVVSDHGSTRIPPSLSNDLDLQYFKSDGFEALSHRYVFVSGEKYAHLPDHLKMDCFYLPANFFLNHQNALCARRGNRFLQTSADEYVHGGLLPEEVVVPLLVFEPIGRPIKDLTVLLLKNEYRYRQEVIELEIGNPNESVIDQIQVSIQNGNVECESVMIPVLRGMTNTSVNMTARFRLTSLPEDKSQLRVRVHYRAHGEGHSFDIPFAITMRKVVEEKGTSIFDD